MEKIRIKRYRDKINYIINTLEEFPYTPQNKLEEAGIFYSLQTTIESGIDLVAMCVKDLGIEVKDDISNIDTLKLKRNLDSDLVEKMKKANGLRNILVHRYNGFDEKIVLNSISEIKNTLYQFLEFVEVCLSEFTQDT